jgi:hypothetical protein
MLRPSLQALMRNPKVGLSGQYPEVFGDAFVKVVCFIVKDSFY